MISVFNSGSESELRMKYNLVVFRILTASPFFFVKKKDGKLQPCQDYQFLNDWTIKNAYPLPLISEIMDKLKGTKYFTKLDVRWGYNNIQIREGDEWKAAFKTNWGLFEPTIMFFGMCNSPATFQPMMDSILIEEMEDGVTIVYMDDILIYATTPELLEKYTKWVLHKLCVEWDTTSAQSLCELNAHNRVMCTLCARVERCRTSINSVERPH